MSIELSMYGGWFLDIGMKYKAATLYNMLVQII
jgi:hypothetical protein